MEVISITRDNHPTILTQLGLTSTDFYYVIERVRRAKQIPYIYHCTYLPERFVTHPHDLSYYNSIYTQMKNEFKIHLNTEPFVEYNQIILPTPKKIAALLEISEETPTVKQERTTTLSLSGQIIEYICSYKRWEYYKVKLESPTQ